MLFYTICLVGASITLLVLSFVWFLGRPTDLLEASGLLENQSCGDNLALIIVTLVMNIVVFALRCRENTSIFTGSMVNLWLTYLLWSALASQPDPYCNTLFGSSAATFF